MDRPGRKRRRRTSIRLAHQPAALSPCSIVNRVPVGIVVPTYNAARYIAPTLASIMGQTMGDFHCCVVDDGSNDGTPDRVRELTAGDGRFTVVEQANNGVAEARNRGLALLAPRTGYLTFFDHDDVWESGALACLLDGASRDRLSVGAHALADYIDETGLPLQPGCFAAYGRSRKVSARGRIQALAPTEPTSFRSLLVSSTVFPPGVVLARSSAYQRVGRFDPRLVPADDWDMLIRLARCGHFVFIDRVIVGYRWHGENQGLTPTMRLANAAVRRTAARSSDNTAEQRAAVRDAWRAIQIVHGRERGQRAWAACRQGDWADAAAEFARVGLAGARYLAGGPSRLTLDGR